MATFQDYQRYRLNRREPHTAPKKLLGWAVIVFAIVVLFWSFTRGDRTPQQERVQVENTNTGVEQEANTNTTPAEETTAAGSAFADLDATLAAYNPAEQCETSISRPGANEVVLTFGLRRDGAGYRDVINTLTEAGVPASFFASGNWAENHPEVIAAITEAGFPIYNQTQSHEDLTTVSEDVVLQELEQADETISKLTNRSTKPFMRPPFGAINDEVFNAAKSAGYCPVLWSVDALDWEQGATALDVVSRVMGKVGGSGVVVLIHVGSDPTAEALPEIIRRVREEGNTFVSLEQTATAE